MRFSRGNKEINEYLLNSGKHRVLIVDGYPGIDVHVWSEIGS